MARTATVYLIALGLAAAASATPQNALPPDYAERVADLERAVQLNPSDLAALDALAGSYAMGARYDRAIAVVEKIRALKRDDPTVTLRLAKLYAWAGQSERALEILERVDLSHDIDAMAFRCQILNDMPRAAEAAACFDTLAKASLHDRAPYERALIGRARNQMWSGDWAAAERSFEEYLRVRPADSSATDSSVIMDYIALLQAAGNYPKAEKLCNQLLQRDPRNAEVLARRAEVLFWAGNRGLEARRNALQAVSLAPGLAGAHVAYIAALETLGLNQAASEEVRSLQTAGPETDLAGYLENRLREQTSIRTDVPFSVYNDADGIHDTTYQVSTAIPVLGDHSLGVNVSQFYSSAPAGSIFTAGRDSTSVREFTVSGNALVAPGIHLSLAGGGSTRSADGAVRPVYSTVLSGSPWDRWTFSVGSAREFLKVTPRAIDQNISSTGGFADLQYRFDSRTTFELKADRRWWSDGNRSIQGDAVFSRNLIYRRRIHVNAGALTSHEAFVLNRLPVSGFFTPDHYSRYDGFLETYHEIGKRVTTEFRVESGTQQIVSTAAWLPNWSVTSRLSVKLGESLRLYASYERKNYTLLARNGWYQGFYVSLRFQL